MFINNSLSNPSKVTPISLPHFTKKMNFLTPGNIRSLINFEKIASNLTSNNYAIYAKYLSYLTIPVSVIFGIANLFHVNLVIVFSIISLVQGVVLLFLEVPFLLKICPLSENFISHLKVINDDNKKKLILYAILAIVQWCSLIFKATSLIVVAVCLTCSFISYGIAYTKDQHISSEDSVIKSPFDDDFAV